MSSHNMNYGWESPKAGAFTTVSTNGENQPQGGQVTARNRSTRMKGAYTHILTACLIITLPIVLLSALLLWFVFHYRVQQSSDFRATTLCHPNTLRTYRPLLQTRLRIRCLHATQMQHELQRQHNRCRSDQQLRGKRNRQYWHSTL
jgi:hypothetical protein